MSSVFHDIPDRGSFFEIVLPVDSERSAIGSRIRRALDAKGISLSEIGRRFGRSQSAVSGWVSGKTQPSLEHLAEICRLTGVSADEILGVGEVGPRPARQMVEMQPAAARRLVRQIQAATRLTNRAAEVARAALEGALSSPPRTGTPRKGGPRS